MPSYTHPPLLWLPVRALLSQTEKKTALQIHKNTHFACRGPISCPDRQAYGRSPTQEPLTPGGPLLFWRDLSTGKVTRNTQFVCLLICISTTFSYSIGCFNISRIKSKHPPTTHVRYPYVTRQVSTLKISSIISMKWMDEWEIYLYRAYYRSAWRPSLFKYVHVYSKNIFLNLLFVFFLFVVASVSYSLLVNYSSGHSLCFFFFLPFFLVKKIIILWWIAPLNPYSQWICKKRCIVN